MKREHARQLRKLIEQTAVNLSDEEALTGIELFPVWTPDGHYKQGDRRRLDGVLYKCQQDHDGLNDPTRNPTIAVSLWVQIDDPSIEFPDWKQPTGAHDAYAQGAKVSHLGKHWISDIEANVYEPSVFGWSEV